MTGVFYQIVFPDFRKLCFQVDTALKKKCFIFSQLHCNDFKNKMGNKCSAPGCNPVIKAVNTKVIYSCFLVTDDDFVDSILTKVEGWQKRLKPTVVPQIQMGKLPEIHVQTKKHLKLGERQLHRNSYKNVKEGKQFSLSFQVNVKLGFFLILGTFYPHFEPYVVKGKIEFSQGKVMDIINKFHIPHIFLHSKFYFSMSSNFKKILIWAFPGKNE